MKISIITVCKNEADTIEKTILSVLEQTYDDFEYIIVDGGSTDGTLDIIEKYRDKLAHFVSEPDTGIYNAMNRGIKLASGNLLNFMNANDWFYNNNIFGEVVRAFEKVPDAKLLTGDRYTIYPLEGAKRPGQPKPEAAAFSGRTGRRDLLNRKFRLSYLSCIQNEFHFFTKNINHQSTFYKKELFDIHNGYDESFKFAADVEKDVLFLVEMKYKAIYLPIIISNFTWGGASNQPQNAKTAKNERERVSRKYWKHYRLLFFALKCFNFLKFFAPKLFLQIEATGMYQKIFMRKNNVVVLSPWFCGQ